jgi:NAD(P)-dependent dehydrogenase (short-subunit alcohol dehydrogenase family)
MDGMATHGMATTPLGGRWTASDIGDQSGRIVLITGATSGLGLESAKALAVRNARVLLAGRDPGRLAAAITAVRAVAPAAPVEGVELDLASLAGIRAAAKSVAERTDRLDVLMNNAGVMAPPHNRTEDGFELQIGTNHLGHFALTGLLLPLLRHDGARVVNVASGAHRMGRLDPDDLNWVRRRYSPWPAYGQSKIANLLFTAELARRAAQHDWRLVAAAAHPGFAATNLQFAGPAFAQRGIGKRLTSLLNPVLGQSGEAGARPQLYAATGPDVRPDDYFGPDGFLEQRGHPKRVGRTAHAADAALAGRLWERSEALTGVLFDGA